MRSWLCLLLLPVVLATGCLDRPSVMVARPQSPRLDDALTQIWTEEIERTARPGDLLLSRSYAMLSDAIVVVTGGEEFSHAAMVDPERGTVIEAVSPKVREVPIAEFVRRNRYVAVVRPARMTEAQSQHALERARSKVGTDFDYGGIFGMDDDETFYCAELVYWASGLDAKHGGRPLVISPAELIAEGQVVYFSGRRDDAQMLRVAAGWLDDRQERTASR